MNATENNSKATARLGMLALVALILLPVSVLVVRAGYWQQGLAVYAISCLTAAILLLVFIIIALLPGAAGKRRSLAMRGLLVVPGTVLFLSVATSRGDHPAIHDISTDVVNPPAFSQAPLLRSASDNPLDVNEETLQAQLAAYPDLKPLQTPLDFDTAFTKALQTARAMGWEITLNDPKTGLIEAVDTTRIMAFKDDIVIRVWHQQGASRIDLRSASRVGVSDIGANAQRIRRYIALFKAS